MTRQIERAIENNELNKDVNDIDEEEANKTAQEILAFIIAYMLVKGQTTYTEGIALLKANNIPIDATSEFIVSTLTRADYQAYLVNVAKSYSKETAESIRNVLAQGQEMGLNKEELATRLREIMNTDEWRVQRLARTEEHRSTNKSSVDAMSQLMNETGAKIYKVWHTVSANPCEFCQAMNGRKELVTDSFLPKGENVVGTDGGIFNNNFVDVDAADLHPNCHCRVKYEVEK